MVASAGVIAVCNDGVSTPTNVDYGQGGEAVDQSASSPMLSAHKISAILPSQLIGDANVCYFRSQMTEQSCNWKGQKNLGDFSRKS